MGRMGFFLGIVAVVGLAVFGLKSSVLSDATKQAQAGVNAAKDSISSAIDRAEQTVAETRAQAAAIAVEAYVAQGGRVGDVTLSQLRQLDPSLDASVRLVRASAASYCVEATYRGATAHATSPGQLAGGRCP
jgi:hypothetical protein